MSDPNRVEDAASAPFVPSGWLLERAISTWQRLRAGLLDDEELVVDESVIAVALRDADAKDPRDLLAALIDATVWAGRRAEEAKTIADEFTARRKRYEERVEAFRVLINELMAAIPVTKHAGRFARAAIVRSPASARITDEGKIPEEYFKIERTLRKADLLADLKVGLVIEGAELSNGGEALRIERLK